jgi:hypothetical protein
VSAILTGFFGGMAIGSAVGGRIADRVRRPLRIYGLLELALVVLVLLTPVTFRLLREVSRGLSWRVRGVPLKVPLWPSAVAIRFDAQITLIGPGELAANVQRRPGVMACPEDACPEDACPVVQYS